MVWSARCHVTVGDPGKVRLELNLGRSVVAVEATARLPACYQDGELLTSFGLLRDGMIVLCGDDADVPTADEVRAVLEWCRATLARRAEVASARG